MEWGMVRRLVTLGKRLRRSVVALTFDAHDFSDPLPCLWSKGLSRQCDFRGPEGYWQAPTESVQSESLFREHYADAHGLVWVRLSTQSRDGVAADLDHFVAAALPSIAKPFVLVTSDGDVSVPSELRPETVAALLSCSWLVAWYTQNHDGSAPRGSRHCPSGSTCTRRGPSAARAGCSTTWRASARCAARRVICRPRFCATSV